MGKFIFFLTIALSGAQASAQGRIVGVSTEGDWTVYETVSEPKECGIISRPLRSVHRRNGSIVNNVRRGDILLAIMIDGDGQAGVSFEGGYPFSSDAGVSVTIDGEKFDFILGNSDETQEFAWPQPEDDERIIESMKRGNEAVAQGESQRGTQTQDSFSLRGVQAGLRAALERCNLQ